MLAEHGGFMPNIDLLRRQMITKQWMEWGTLISVRQYENCIKLLGTTHRRTIKWTNPILRDFQVFITGKDSNWMILLTNDMTIGWDSILSGRTFHLNVVFFSFLVSTDVTNLFCQRFRRPCADENVASASSCLHISLPRAYALVGLGNLLPRPRCRGCFSILWEYYCVFLSFHDTSAKLSFRGASTPFRACSHTHVLTLLWLDEYYRRLTIKKRLAGGLCVFVFQYFITTLWPRGGVLWISSHAPACSTTNFGFKNILSAFC